MRGEPIYTNAAEAVALAKLCSDPFLREQLLNEIRAAHPLTVGAIEQRPLLLVPVPRSEIAKGGQP